ncbi:hypothetical protein [Micromonospora sp. NBC_00421]|uniref:hypothetical protein n=1 Tax=Micromonospora sp. NBC_00421 TaxID=2975976 RepID=UPI002E1C9EBE
MTGVWGWQLLGRSGEIRTYGTVHLWGDLDEQHEQAHRWAADRMCAELWRVEPRWERLSGWRVRVWSGQREAVAEAEEWLAVLRAGPLARVRDRVELLSRPVGRSLAKVHAPEVGRNRDAVTHTKSG